MSGLVERARAGDADAFELLVRQRIERVYRQAVAILGDPAEAEDATQETFVAAWRNLPRLRKVDAFDAWLDRVALNSCRLALRRRRRLREVSLESLAAARAAPGIAPAAFDRAFERLDAGQRALLVLHHLERQPLTDIADRLRVPVGTVKSRLFAARRALARALEEERR